MSTLGIQPRLDYELRIPKGREQFVPANRLNDEDIKYGVEGQTEFLAGYKPGVKYHEIKSTPTGVMTTKKKQKGRQKPLFDFNH